MSLAEASEARKARLQALRRKKLGQEDGRGGGESQDSEVVIKGRNFDPETRTLRKGGRDEDDTVEKIGVTLAQKIVEDDEVDRQKELSVHTIAPKRANWDLKRQLEKRLAKLDRKTQVCINTLIRQRLAAQKGESDDLVGAMKAEEEAQKAEPPSDDDDEEFKDE